MYIVKEKLLQIFFFQAEDGIRDGHVTGVQTCALPILEVKRVTYDLHSITAEIGAPNIFDEAFPDGQYLPSTFPGVFFMVRLLDAGPYIGLPYEFDGRGPRYDCWGLACLIYRQELMIDVPS